MSARPDDVALEEKGGRGPSSSPPRKSEGCVKKLGTWRLIALILAILVILMIIIIAVIAWLLVDVSIKNEGDDDSTTEPLPTSNYVSFSSDNPNGNGVGLLFGDPEEKPKCLIAIHGWWGTNKNFQKQGAMMSRDGDLTVLIPDMYRGERPEDREEAGHLSQGLDWPGAIQDMSAAATYLLGQGCNKVGVTGFCMGGALTLAAAANSTGISAAAPFYGIPNAALIDVTTITIPIQGHFAKQDPVVGFSSPADYNAFRDKMVAAGRDLTMYEYDANHGFANVGEEAYHKASAEKAMLRLYEFMHDKL